MSKSWEMVRKRLQELQKSIPEPLLIELVYHDGTSEQMPLDEVLSKDNAEWKTFRVVSGNSKAEAARFLDWLAPNCAIDREV